MKCFYDTTLVLLVIRSEIRVVIRIARNVYNLSINTKQNLNKPRKKKRANIYYNLKLLKPRMTKWEILKNHINLSSKSN
jgi:hypothetical protein